jgi:hypothetical protein
LLAWPELWHARPRDVAHAAGVSLGQAHNALALLAEAGYSSDETWPGQTPLLELWAAASPTGLATKLTLASFHGDVDELNLVTADDVAYFSGEKAAGDLLRQATMTLYVRTLNSRLPIVDRWRTDKQPNIVVRRAFWHAPTRTRRGRSSRRSLAFGRCRPARKRQPVRRPERAGAASA